MNESTCSSAFQKKLRLALPGAEVIKHADKSMIGMVDASVTFNKQTLWMEYKFIAAHTKGVTAEFLKTGRWNPAQVASASPTQFKTACRLAGAGHCIYLFWVLDNLALRKRVGSVVLWHPISKRIYKTNSTDEMVDLVRCIMVNDVMVKPTFDGYG